MPEMISRAAAAIQGQNPGQDLGRIIDNVVQRALGSAKAELQKELVAAEAKRDALQDRVTQMPPDSRARNALEQQLSRADRDVDRIEAAIERLEGRSDASTRETFTLVPPPPPPFNGGVSPRPFIPFFIIVFIGFPLALAFARNVWRRGSRAQPALELGPEVTRRFNNLEQSVDSIAVEIERISENQRYLTKVLSESKPASVSGGAPGPGRLA
jgi:hypothetical protein